MEQSPAIKLSQSSSSWDTSQGDSFPKALKNIWEQESWSGSAIKEARRRRVCCSPLSNNTYNSITGLCLSQEVHTAAPSPANWQLHTSCLALPDELPFCVCLGRQKEVGQKISVSLSSEERMSLLTVVGRGWLAGPWVSASTRPRSGGKPHSNETMADVQYGHELLWPAHKHHKRPLLSRAIWPFIHYSMCKCLFP